MTFYLNGLNDVYPYSAIVQVVVNYTDGTGVTGSGVVVGINDVLTAAHVVYNPFRTIEEITIIPGLDQGDQPFGTYDGRLWNYFEINSDGSAGLTSDETEFDLALVGLDRPIGNAVGAFAIGTNATDGTYSLTGYPGAYSVNDESALVQDTGLVTKPFDTWEYQGVESNPGNSGGPLWTFINGQPTVVGIASTTAAAADVGPRIDTIQQWINGNDYLLSASELAQPLSGPQARLFPVGASSDAYPLSAVVRVVATFEDGSTAQGAGVVIGRNDVLTASTVVYDGVLGAATDVVVMPGYDNGEAPYGSFTAKRWTYFRVDEDGDDSLDFSEIQNDIALLAFEQPLGDRVGWFGYDLGASSGTYNFAGYPDRFDINGFDAMYQYQDTLTRFVGDGVWAYDHIESEGGNGGGPIWYDAGEGPRVVGLISTTNYGVDIAKRWDEFADLLVSNDDIIDPNAPQFLSGSGGADTLEGGDGNDTLDGGNGPDQLISGLGNDFSTGGEGNDALWGMDGNDSLVGGAGADSLFGNRGADTIRGGDGDDLAKGHPENDVIFGDAGFDLLFGGGNDDSMDGGANSDTVNGNSGFDTIFGGGGNDIIRGQGGRDSLDGGIGDDLIVGMQGFDTLVGGDGNDTLIGGPADDTLAGGSGADTFVFAADQGANRITDFQVNVDTLSLSGIGSFGALNLIGSPSGAQFSFLGTTVTLSGVTPAQLDAGDFVFA